MVSPFNLPVQEMRSGSGPVDLMSRTRENIIDNQLRIIHILVTPNRDPNVSSTTARSVHYLHPFIAESLVHGYSGSSYICITVYGRSVMYFCSYVMTIFNRLVHYYV